MMMEGPCRHCGLKVEEHTLWEERAPCYRTLYVCPEGTTAFQPLEINCCNCGRPREEHEVWKGYFPNRTDYLCIDRNTHFETPADKDARLRSVTSRRGKRWVDRNPTL